MGKQGFKGISFPFRFNGRGGVATSGTSANDFSHIRESIIQILGTRLGERVNELNFGSEVYKVQFEEIDDGISASELKLYVTEAIKTWDKRVTINNIVVEPFSDENGSGFIVAVSFNVSKYMQDIDMSFSVSKEGIS